MLRRLAIAAVLAFATSAQAQLHPLPAQPPGVAWPGADWETAPLPDDVDRAAYDLAVTEAFAGVHPLMGETRAVVIVAIAMMALGAQGIVQLIEMQKKALEW